MDKRSTFSVPDYIVFFLTIAVAFSIGVFFAFWERKKKRETPEHYFLAGRKAQMLPVTLSFVVTFQSSITMLGNPAEVYAYGLMIAYNVVAVLFAFVLTAYVVVPVFHPLRLTSIYEYFQLRYHDNYLRYWTMITGSFYSIFYMGTVTYGTSVALEIVMGIPTWGTILIYTMVTAVYTSIGGIKAVIWTDVFQFVVMFTGVIAVIVKGTIDTGGSAKVFEYGASRMKMDELSFDPRVRYTVWNVCIGSASFWLYTSFMQPAMQRVYTTPNVRAARQLYLYTIPLFATLLLLACFEGVVIFAYYVAKRCDILEGGVVSNINGVVPFTVLDLFKDQPGLPGLFIAALSSAALSTLSSCLSSLSAVTYEDVIKVKYPDMDLSHATRLSKIAVMVYGFIALAMAFAISAMPGSVVALFQAFVACLDGSTCAIFILSITFRRATTKGIFGGAILGMAFPLWINFGKMFDKTVTNPYLESGPVDGCSSLSAFDDVDVNVTYRNAYTTATYSSHLYNASTLASQVTENPLDVAELTPLQNLYSMSFMWLSLSGFLTTVLFAVSISICTTPPAKINERCLFSFRKHVVQELFPDSRTGNNREDTVYEKVGNDDNNLGKYANYESEI